MRESSLPAKEVNPLISYGAVANRPASRWSSDQPGYTRCTGTSQRLLHDTRVYQLQEIDAVHSDGTPGTARFGNSGGAGNERVFVGTESKSLKLSSSEGRVAMVVVASAVESPQYGQHQVLCCTMSGNALSLLTAACLFALMTVTQYIFGVIAHSESLQADCVSMGVDSLTYMASLYVECLPATMPVLQKRRIELGMAGVSFALLLAFTCSFLVEACQTVLAPDEDAEHVTGYIVLALSLTGLLFDAVSLLVFHSFGEKAHRTHGSEKAMHGISFNMCAALLHLISDLLRSTTTTIESIVILSDPSAPSQKVDGYAALVVCSTIAVGAVAGMYSWGRAVYHHMKGLDQLPEDPSTCTSLSEKHELASNEEEEGGLVDAAISAKSLLVDDVKLQSQ